LQDIITDVDDDDDDDDDDEGPGTVKGLLGVNVSFASGC